MYLWMTRFETLSPLQSVPRVSSVCTEIQYESGYHLKGKLRPDHHCLFKYTLAGTGAFSNATGEHRTPAGTGFLCEVDDPNISYYYPSDGRSAWEFVYITFAGGWAESLVGELVGRYGPTFSIPLSDPVIKKMMSYEAFDGTHCELAPSEGGELVSRLLMRLAESKERGLSKDPANILVRKAQEEVLQNLDSNINVADLAKTLKVSREHLSRVFRQSTLLTPHQYIVRQKTLLACRLLKDTSLTSKEVSVRLGYTAPGHFSRAFKETMKMTPAEFRENGAMPTF